MKIAILLYEKVTALDFVGPYEVLSRIPNAEICFVGIEKGQIANAGGLKFYADFSLQDITQADILLIPGGFGIDALLHDTALISWIKQMDRNSQWTASVCSGVLLLAETGIIKGKKCTTHWRRKEQLKKYDVEVVDERYVQDGKYITSAGVSAGIDMALFLTGKIVGDKGAMMIQQGIEYNPMPPYRYEPVINQS
jgi:transcriptional regulator GlxA family with amidase domain